MRLLSMSFSMACLSVVVACATANDGPASTVAPTPAASSSTPDAGAAAAWKAAEARYSEARNRAEVAQKAGRVDEIYRAVDDATAALAGASPRHQASMGPEHFRFSIEVAARSLDIARLEKDIAQVRANPHRDTSSWRMEIQAHAALALAKVDLTGTGCTPSAADACVTAGEAALIGRGVPRDVIKAQRLFMVGCDNGNGPGRACTRLASMARDNVGVPFFSESETGDLYEKACVSDGAGCTQLAEFHLDRFPTSPGGAEMLELVRDRCELAPVACGGLGALTERGLSMTNRAGSKELVAKDLQAAARLFRTACDAGEVRSCTLFGNLIANGVPVLEKACPAEAAACRVLALNLKDPAAVRAAYEKGCAAGDERSCRKVIFGHFEGTPGYTKDLAKALQLSKESCVRTANTCYLVGEAISLARKQGLKRPDLFDDTTSLEANRSGCLRGAAESCVLLGQAFALGKGVPKDEAAARAVSGYGCDDRKHPEACFTLGLLTTSIRAQSAFQIACDGDVAEACYRGGLIELTTFNERRGMEHLTKACDKGVEAACAAREEAQYGPNIPERTDITQADLEARVAAGEDFSGQTFARLSLPGAKLKGGKFKGARFAGVNLSGADLSGADLSGATFVQVTLKSARLVGATFEKASLEKMRFDGAILVDADVRARFRGADLPLAVFDGVKADGVDFSGATGKGVSFAGASLKKANLSHTTFDKSSFDGATLEGANLDDANLVGASMTRAKMTGCSLSNGGLSLADLRGAVLDGCDLSSTDFSDSDLGGASIKGARFSGTNFLHTNLAGVNVCDIKPSTVKFKGTRYSSADPSTCYEIIEAAN